MKGRVLLSPSFGLLLAGAACVMPGKLLAMILLSAAAHELGHLFFLARFGVEVKSLRLTALGAEICAPGAARLSYGRELLVTLAGAAVNALLALSGAAAGVRLHSEDLLVLAGANTLLALYNLLPVPPLDGGRALYLAVSYFFGPAAGDAAASAAGVVCSAMALAFGIYISVLSGGGWFFLFASLSLFLRMIFQLVLAKTGRRV